MEAASPTVLKRWLAAELRQRRVAAGVTREQAAAQVRGSVQNIGHIENGRSLPGPLELERLLEFYGAGDRAEFWLGVRERAKRGKDWWAPFDGSLVPADRGLFLGLESSATAIEGWDAQLVPDLLQTPEYALAAIQGGTPGRTLPEVAGLVELRMARQRVVLGGRAPVRRVVAESALRWQVGDREVLRSQLAHLVDVVRRPEVEVRVLPFAAGVAPTGSFDVLSFPEEVGDRTAVHVDTEVADLHFEEPERVRRYRGALERLRDRALGPEESVDYIRQVAAGS
ncbi:helix-turn-helix domain-containing protein [Actinokineospora bangkokensis]|uniref:HTH cro/C1-type domain-containing protein n=1 Tax=Actinokineospora bangkokensis TaxID=1193682 RepID=A0A1Q9LKM9_9PSEU|nr:helix-turn-helix transcriptional regulator [Actinokineospora bangkokensis]OLR92539.1 hypothetical protein BJP25_20980 [Actinokineospora bangkokensis]